MVLKLGFILGVMMKYKDELINSMEWLGQQDDTIFMGQSVKYSGNKSIIL